MYPTYSHAKFNVQHVFSFIYCFLLNCREFTPCSIKAFTDMTVFIRTKANLAVYQHETFWIFDRDLTTDCRSNQWVRPSDSSYGGEKQQLQLLKS